jgi:hypothetical protein
MSAHLNVLSTYGVTVPSGSETESATKTTTVEISELLAAATAHVIDAKPVNIGRVEVQVDGEGPVGVTLTPGTIANVSTVTLVGADITEQPNQRCRFSLRGAASIAFSDPEGTSADVGDEPEVTDLEVTSVTYSIVESVRRSVTLEDQVLVGTDGTPAARGTLTERRPFAIAGRGDKPAGVALGTGGAEFAGADAGLTIVGVLRESERRGDWNGWGADGTQYPQAA